jgi:uncharacterized protein
VILADTGVIFGATDRDDPRHNDCAALLESHVGALIVPTPVIVESAWLIESRLGSSAEATFLRAVHAGELERVDLTVEDWARVIELLDAYADSPLGLVDASVVAVAERLRITRIATLDHRHFRVIRPAHAEAFDLLP